MKISKSEESILFDLMSDVVLVPANSVKACQERHFNYCEHLMDKYGKEETAKAYNRCIQKMTEFLILSRLSYIKF